jgi:hypothetical protein
MIRGRKPITPDTAQQPDKDEFTRAAAPPVDGACACGTAVAQRSPVLDAAQAVAYCSAEASHPSAASFSPGPATYDLRHACLSTWLNGGVYPTQVAEWAGHSVDVLLRMYAKCVVGQDELARRRISEALRQS